MIKRGFGFKPKQRVPKEFVPDLSSTSRAKKSLEFARKTQTPEIAAQVESAVSEAYPDIMLDRRINH